MVPHLIAAVSALTTLVLLIHQTIAIGHRELGEECEARVRYSADDLYNRNLPYQPTNLNSAYPYANNFNPSFQNPHEGAVNVTNPNFGVSNIPYPDPNNPDQNTNQLNPNYNPNFPGSKYATSPGGVIPESRRCRSERGLYCDEYSRRCKCHELSGSIYNYDTGRCELPIDHFCTTKPVSNEIGAGIDYEHFCPEDATCTCNYHHYDRRYWTACNNENGLCKCNWGYRPYDDMMACWWSKGHVTLGSAAIVLIVPLLASTLVHYIV